MGLLMSCLGLSAKAPEAVERIEPEYWVAGRKQTELQLMVYGDGIAKADVALAGSTLLLSSMPSIGVRSPVAVSICSKVL